ncbi:MAG: hypothetical protein WCL46_08440 [Chlorobium sp.]
MCDKENSKEYPINNFEIALRMRNFEIEQLTQRNSFLMVFQGVLFAGLLQSNQSKLFVNLMVCFTGCVVSWYQIKMASGAKFWQCYWEKTLGEYECETRMTDKPELFHKDDSLYESKVETMMDDKKYNRLTKWLVISRFSVSRIPIHVGIWFLVIWVILVLYFCIPYIFSFFDSALCCLVLPQIDNWHIT